MNTTEGHVWQDLAERAQSFRLFNNGFPQEIRDWNLNFAMALGWRRFTPSQLRRSNNGWISPDDFIGTYSNGSPVLDSLHGTTIHRAPPQFYLSLDAIRALVHQRFPGWFVLVCSHHIDYQNRPYAEITSPDLFLDDTVAPLKCQVGAAAATEPLALAAAFCLACKEESS